MAVVDVVAAGVRPLIPQCIIRRFQASGVVNVGDVVYINTSGLVVAAINTSLAACQAVGIVVSVSALTGKTASVANDWVDVVTEGAVYVNNTTAMTIGAVGYVSATAGGIDQTISATSGRYNYVIGRAIGANTFYVSGAMNIPTVVP